VDDEMEAVPPDELPADIIEDDDEKLEEKL